MRELLSFLGLAQRAGCVINGEKRVLHAMTSSKPPLVFLASDAGANIKKKIIDKAKTYNIAVIDHFDSESLSHAVGKENRKTLAVTDEHFIAQIKRRMRSERVLTWQKEVKDQTEEANKEEKNGNRNDPNR